ncbi:MAG: hypothetical protein LBT89_04225 [Planctomycetaceae bacterium]|nr:hypothetical protein [Planctomycetaceae bacterium]
MKKFVLFAAAVILLSAFTAGCSSSSGTSWCRSGSLFPTARNKQKTETVYLTAATGTGIAASQCDPCTPNQCQPCEPAACQPCDPVCNPCDSCSNTGAVSPVRGVVVPGPVQ